jgi:hypothetical protein
VRLEVVDLRDQVVDALGRVAPPLVGLEDLAVERAQALALLGELAAQRRVLALQALPIPDELRDGALEALEIERAPARFRDFRNDGTPNRGNRTGRDERPSSDRRENVRAS